MPPPPLARLLIKAIHGHPRTLPQLMGDLKLPAAVVLNAILLARAEGLVVFARNNKPDLTTYEFIPPEIRR